MAERRQSVTCNVKDIIQTDVAGNEIAATEKTCALLSEVWKDKSGEAAKLAVVALAAGEYDVQVERRQAAVTLLRDVIEGCPHKAGAMSEVLLYNTCWFPKEFRLGGILHLTKVVAGFPEESTTVLNHFLKASQVEDRRVIELALVALDSLLFYCPWQTKGLFVRNDVVWQVSRVATWHLGRLFSLYPEETNNVLAILFSRCSHTVQYVREAVVYQLSSALVACPESAENIVDALIYASQDASRVVQTAALSQFQTTIEVAPESVEVIIATILSQGRSYLGRAERAWMRQLLKLAEACPAKAEELVATFLEKYPTARTKTKVVLAKGLLTAKQMFPLSFPRSWKLIVDGMLLIDRDDREPLLRATVVEVLGELITFVPDVDHPRFIRTLFMACVDTHNLVRAAAMAQLVSCGTRIQSVADRCATALLQGCEDPNPHVKSEALRQLCYAAKSWPRRIPRMIDLVLRGCCDEDSYVRRVAAEALERILRYCPNEAIALLQSVVGQAEEASSSRSGSKRKRCDSPCEEGQTNKRRDNDDSVCNVPGNERMAGLVHRKSARRDGPESDSGESK